MENIEKNGDNSKLLGAELYDIAKRLFDIVGSKKIINQSPEILDELNRLTSMLQLFGVFDNENMIETGTFNIPYPVGTYLKKKKSLIDHVDKVYEYVIDENGIYVTLLLDALRSHARKSTKIDIECLTQEWTIADDRDIEREKSKQRILNK